MESRSRQSFRLHSLDQWSRQMANSRHRRLFLEKLEPRQVLAASPWHNALNPFDVDADGRANAVDRSTLSNFLSANGAVAVPALPTPDPTRQLFYDVSGDFVVDRVDLDELTNFLLGGKDDSPLPPGAMGPVPLGGETESSSSSFGPSGPTGPQTPTVGITVLTHIVEGDPERTTFHITRAPTTGSLTVNFEVDPSSTASPSDYTSAVLASGSVTFADGQSTFHIPVAGIDDSLLENFETLVAKILPSTLYNIQFQAERATSEIHDGEHGLEDTGHAVEWEEFEDDWKSIADDEVIWIGANNRWIPNIPSQLVGQINWISWYRRPHDNPNADWDFFAGDTFSPGETDYEIEGSPWIGHWDIMYRAGYGALSWFQAVARERAVNGIERTYWTRGHALQQFEEGTFNEGPAVRVFPERYAPFETHPDQNKVNVVVELFEHIPFGFRGDVKVKAFDPDHAFDPQVPDPGATTPFDPNDRFIVNNGQPSTETRPQDNRDAAGGFGMTVGGTLDEEVLQFHAPTISKSTTFTINDIQPGNNFLVVACVKRRNEAFNGTDTVTFASDGTSLLYLSLTYRSPSVFSSVPPANQTKLLTVWRTLWIELDSMSAPSDPDPNGADGPFNQPLNDPEYDLMPGDLQNVPIDLLAPNLLPASIVVRLIAPWTAIPAGADTRDELTFSHYVDQITPDPGPPPVPGPAAGANRVRDIPSLPDQWVAHLIGAYELSTARDFDDDVDDFLGLAVAGTNTAYVFYETIRDRAVGQANVPASVDEPRLLLRTVLHETGHLLGAAHGNDDEDGIMNPEESKTWQDDSKAVFTNRHFGIFQSIEKPQWQ